MLLRISFPGISKAHFQNFCPNLVTTILGTTALPILCSYFSGHIMVHHNSQCHCISGVLQNTNLSFYPKFFIGFWFG
jgi:hypothetical protein